MAGHDKNVNKTYRADQSVNICLVLSRLRDSTVQPARLFLATNTSTFQTVIARPDNTLHDLVEIELSSLFACDDKNPMFFFLGGGLLIMNHKS